MQVPRIQPFVVSAVIAGVLVGGILAYRILSGGTQSSSMARPAKADTSAVKVVHPVPSAAAAPVEGSPETAIYGIALLKPLKGFDACPNEPMPANEPGLHSEFEKRRYTASKAPCFHHGDFARVGGGAPTGTETLNIVWPDDKVPEMCQYVFCEMSVKIVNGVVHDIKIVTRGISTQERDYGLLVDKFGAPATKKIKTLQNGMGATFDTIQAVWARPDGVTIIFDGELGDLDRGQLWVVSAQEVARLSAQKAKADEGKPQL